MSSRDSRVVLFCEEQYAAFVLHGIHTLEICTELLLDAFPHSLLTVDRVVVFALVVVVVGCLLLSLFYCSTTNQPPRPESPLLDGR